MQKKIIGIIVVLAVIAAGLYLRYYYPGSQFQLKNSLRRVVATPIEHFFNATEKSCGIWYERDVQSNGLVAGKGNDKVKSCFNEAFKKCQVKNILQVKDMTMGESQSIIYSLIRILRGNDAGECIVQNYYEEYSMNGAVENQIPINYINTCTVLADKIYNSCEPLYVKQQREKMGY